MVELLAFSVVLAWALYRGYRMRKALTAELPDDRCVSCGSAELFVQGEGVYVCQSCGYEGGSQRAALQLEDRRRARLALPEDRRRTLALELLDEARNHLLAADGTFDEAWGAGLADLVGLDGNPVENNTAHAAMTRAMGEVERGHQLLGEVIELLDLAPVGETASAPLVVWQADDLVDTLAADLLLLRDVGRRRAHAQGLLAQIESLQTRVQASLSRPG